MHAKIQHVDEGLNVICVAVVLCYVTYKTKQGSMSNKEYMKYRQV
jgi:hypothetical protein